MIEKVGALNAVIIAAVLAQASAADAFTCDQRRFLSQDTCSGVRFSVFTDGFTDFFSGNQILFVELNVGIFAEAQGYDGFLNPIPACITNDDTPGDGIGFSTPDNGGCNDAAFRVTTGTPVIQ